MKQNLILTGLIISNFVYGQRTYRAMAIVSYAETSLKSEPDYIKGEKIFTLKKGDSIPLIGFTKEIHGFAHMDDYYTCYFGNQLLYVETKTVDIDKSVSDLLKKNDKATQETLIQEAIAFENLQNEKFKEADSKLIIVKSKYSSIEYYDTADRKKLVGVIPKNDNFYVVASIKDRYYSTNYFIVYKGSVYFIKDGYKIDNLYDYSNYLTDRGNRNIEFRISNTISKSQILEETKAKELAIEKAKEAEKERIKETLYLKNDSSFILGKAEYEAKLLSDDFSSAIYEINENQVVFPFRQVKNGYTDYYEAFVNGNRGFIETYSLEISDSSKEYLRERGSVNLYLRTLKAKYYDSLYTQIKLKEATKKLTKYKQMQFVVRNYEIYSHNKYSDATDLKIDFFNGTNKTIKYIWFSFVPYNRVGDIVSDYGKTSAQVKGIGPIESLSGGSLTFERVFYNAVIDCVKITGIKVQYTDGSVKTLNVANTLDEGVANNCK